MAGQKSKIIIMPDNKKKRRIVTPIDTSKMSKAEKKALFAKFRSDRENQKKQTSGNNKTNKTHRNTVKNNKRIASEERKNRLAADGREVDKWGMPINENIKDNPYRQHIQNTSKMVLMGKDPISKAFKAVAGTALTGGIAGAVAAKGLVKTSKAIKTAGKISKAKDI